MPDSPRLVARHTPSSGIPRLRQRVFLRFAVVLAAVVAVTVTATLLVQQITQSTLLLGVAGGAAGLAAAGFASAMWSKRFEKRLRELIQVIESGSPLHGQELARQTSDRLFAEVIAVWQNAVKTLQDGWQSKHEEARRSYETLAELIRMMAKAVDERAAYLRGHSERVARYAAAIARKMGLDEEKVEWIRLSGLLHDIGTLGIEDYLVMKDAPLAPEEFEIVKAHTVKGAAILRPIEMLHELIPGVELHHESLDGMGYPYGLKGDQIPLMARIIAVADSFDAMTTPRPYQAAMNPDYVLEVMQRLSGTRYDTAVVDALAALVRSGALEVKKLRVPVSFRMRRPTAEVV
ncbi:MAG TPA: HD-GYP domain-containing protein [Acidobacteriaceae bacterium]|jgi:putative nucleotidyltransferase with HDIG domain|nr:HD-GYP domain-containing protein [Acidobacteriaceae bacterium]